MIRRDLIAVLLFSIFSLLPPLSPPVDCSTTTPSSPSLLHRYQQALAADPDNLVLRYLYGVALLEADRNQEAYSAFRTAYPAYRDSVEANYNLSVASMRVGDIDSALLYLDQAEALGAAEQLQLYPLENLYFNLALMAQERNQQNETIRLFLKVLELNPNQTEVYRQLGDLYARRGETELATRAFHKYLEQAPGDPLSRDYLFALEFNRAQDLMAAGDLQGAAAGFRVALEIDPNSPETLYYLGYLAHSQNEADLGLPFLFRAFQLADSSLQRGIRPLLYNSSLTLKQSGQLDAALKPAILLAQQPDADARELFLAGTLSMEAARHRQALDYLQRANRLEPNQAPTLKNLLAAEQGAYREWLETAGTELERQKFIAADEALRKAEQLRPGDPKTATLRAQMTVRRNALLRSHLRNAEEALQAEHFRVALDEAGRALALGPEEPDALFMRDRVARVFAEQLNSTEAMARQALAENNWQEADALVQTLYALDPDNPSVQDLLSLIETVRDQALGRLLAAGQAALDSGNLVEAREQYSEALRLDPEQPEAAAGLDTVRRLLANRIEEYLQKANRAIERSRFEEAAQWLDKASTLDLTEAVTMTRSRLAEHRLQKLAALVKEAARLTGQKNYKRAQALYNQALSLQPDQPEALAGQADLHRLMAMETAAKLSQAEAALSAEQFAVAMKAYRAVLDLDPGQRSALAGITQVRNAQAGKVTAGLSAAAEQLDAGNLEAAERQLHRLSQLDPYHAGLRELQSRLEQLRLSGAQPGDEQKIYLQGVAFYTQGQYQEAIKSWETVLSLDPEHAKARQNIDKTRRKLRQLEEYRGN